jgi:hypothetical protein
MGADQNYTSRGDFENQHGEGAKQEPSERAHSPSISPESFTRDGNTDDKIQSSVLLNLRFLVRRKNF